MIKSMPSTYRAAMLFALAGCLSLVCAFQTKADTTTITISNPNTAIACCTGPYATVDINRTSTTTATITFSSLTNGGYIYLMGDGGTADLNVNGTYSLGAVTESNSVSNLFTPTYLSNTPGQVDGFGQFNLSLNNTDGFTDSATSISFTLTATGATTWGSAADVLVANSGGSTVAIHAFACAVPGCSTTSGAFATGFAANGSQVPEPVSMLLFGSGLVAIGAKLRRRKSLNPVAA
jgi:hypothetical protein